MEKLEQEYVKKRKRKKAAAIVSAVGAAGTSALAIVSFLGRFVGTFTVTLNTGVVKLALSEQASFSSQTSYLHVSEIKTFEEYTFSDVLNKTNIIDNEQSDYLIGANYNVNNDEVVSMNYFKYTFFVKNVGEKPCRYDFKVKIIQNDPSKDGRYIDNLIRVMLYSNDEGDGKHDYKVYAKKSSGINYDLDGKETQQEYISIPPSKADAAHPFPGFAEMFESDQTICTIPVPNFEVDAIKRYTIVTWVEGEDPQSIPTLEAPEGANLKLGVEINAYENKQ